MNYEVNADSTNKCRFFLIRFVKNTGLNCSFLKTIEGAKHL